MMLRQAQYKKIALVYDRVNKWGGAERVLLALHELFPDAPLFTSVYNPQTAGWAEEFKVKNSFLQNFPYAKTSHELYPLLMPIAFESFNFDEYDLVISVTSEAAKGIITKPTTKHICYCLTPTRYLWSGFDEYFSNPLLRGVATPAIRYLRSWDKIAAQKPDVMLAISQEVKKRINLYYQRDTNVIYPPVSLGLTDIPDLNTKTKEDDYYLVVSRLVPYKKIHLAVEACTKLNKKLIVIGIGSELEKIKSLAGPTISFMGAVTDSQLASYYKNAQALLFPGMEDFGITMVESLAFGTPVIAFKAGGALEIVSDEKTGLLFSPQTVSGLVKAIKSFEEKKFNKKIIQQAAQKFSQEKFKKEFSSLIDELFAK